MPRATITARSLTLAALTLAAVTPGCGGERDTQPAPAAGAQTAEQALARRLDGLYTASVRRVGGRASLRGVHVPAGLWALRIDVGARVLRLIAPEGGDISLRLADLDAAHLRLAPDTACETHAGRTAASRFAWIRTDAVLRLRGVRTPCASDAAILTSVSWRAAWPTTALTANVQP